MGREWTERGKCIPDVFPKVSSPLCLTTPRAALIIPVLPGSPAILITAWTGNFALYGASIAILDAQWKERISKAIPGATVKATAEPGKRLERQVCH